MKRILNYILIPLALTVLSACVHDEKEVFDESASVRIAKSLEEDAKILESATNGWQLHYYTGKEYRYGGYTYLIKFKNGKATVAADFAGSDSISTSKYELKKDQGPILTFTTFNAIMHEKAQAKSENINGEEGDYEFLILKATTDTIHLKGKKWGNHMYLTRLANNINWKEHLDSINAISDEISNNYEVSLGEGDVIGSALFNTLSRHAIIKVENNSYSCAYATTPTGVILPEPIFIRGKEYRTFTLNTNNQNLNNGDITFNAIIPEGYKPASFWVGKWKINHQGGTNAFAIVKQGKGKSLDVAIEFGGVSYPLVNGYNSNAGCLQFLMQHIDVKSTVAPGGVLFTPVSIKSGGFFNLAEGAGANFIWDEASKSAKLVSNGVGKYETDTFVGIAFKTDGKPVENAQGRYIYPVILYEITSLTRVN
ncbi:MAG: DUF4302 domain-containing protein [Prevotella sp.]